MQRLMFLTKKSYMLYNVTSSLRHATWINYPCRLDALCSRWLC